MALFLFFNEFLSIKLPHFKGNLYTPWFFFWFREKSPTVSFYKLHFAPICCCVLNIKAACPIGTPASHGRMVHRSPEEKSCRVGAPPEQGSRPGTPLGSAVGARGFAGERGPRGNPLGKAPFASAHASQGLGERPNSVQQVQQDQQLPSGQGAAAQTPRGCTGSAARSRRPRLPAGLGRSTRAVAARDSAARPPALPAHRLKWSTTLSSTRGCTTTFCTASSGIATQPARRQARLPANTGRRRDARRAARPRPAPSGGAATSRGRASAPTVPRAACPPL